MKKLAMILMVVMAAMTSLNAQETQVERMKFMGKSMNCTKEVMSSYLQGRGFKYIRKEDNVIFLKGTFQGYLNCTVVIREDYGLISFCRVILPENSYDQSWNKLYNDYENMVSKIESKYGEATFSEEYFDDEPSYGLSDYSKLDYLKKEKCHYYALWKVEAGMILVSIDSSEQVFIDYYDAVNYDKIEQKQNDEL